MASLFRKREILQNKSKLSADVGCIQHDQVQNPYTEILILAEHTDIVKILVTVDEERFVSVSDDNIAFIWNVNTGHKMATLAGHTRPILCCIALSVSQTAERTNRCILTGSADKTIRIWNADTAESMRVITDHNCSAKVFVPLDNPDLFCVGSNDLFLFGLDGHLYHRLEQKEEADVSHILPIPNERVVVASGKSLEVLGVVSMPDATGFTDYHLDRVRKLHPPHREPVTFLAPAADGFFISASLDGTIALWNTHMLSASRQFNSHDKVDYYVKGFYPYSVQHLFSVEERYLFAAIGCGFSIFDIVTGATLVHRREAHHLKIVQMKLVYNGMFLATCSEDGTIRLWGGSHRPNSSSQDNDDTTCAMHRLLGRSPLQPADNGQQLQLSLLGELLGHSGSVNMMLDYGDNGLVTCGMDRLVILWKDGDWQSARRNKLIQEITFSEVFA